MYHTEHHAKQMARALELNGLQAAVDQVRLPDDALTALTVSPRLTNYGPHGHKQRDAFTAVSRSET
jgi:hypothetical protein